MILDGEIYTHTQNTVIFAQNRQFLKFQKPIFGRKQTNFGRYVIGRSEVSQSLPKIFFMGNGQKFAILSKKNRPPPQKKGPFFFWGGSEIKPPVNLRVTWAELKKCGPKCVALGWGQSFFHLKTDFTIRESSIDVRSKV